MLNRTQAVCVTCARAGRSFTARYREFLLDPGPLLPWRVSYCSSLRRSSTRVACWAVATRPRLELFFISPRRCPAHRGQGTGETA